MFHNHALELLNVILALTPLEHVECDASSHNGAHTSQDLLHLRVLQLFQEVGLGIVD